MANLREIRSRIKGVANTAKITSAMKMVSAAKLKRAQSSIESARPYVQKMQGVLSNLVENTNDDYSNPLSSVREEIKNIAIIVVSSDRGLCGSFNSNLIKDSWNFIHDTLLKDNPNLNIDILPVGKKAVSFYKKNTKGITVGKNFPDIFGKLEFSTAKAIVDEVKSRYISADLDKVYVFVNEFISVIKQVPKRHQLLPISTLAEEESSDSNLNTDYIYEPNQTSILDELLPKLLDISMWRFLLESNAAEQASRMMAMDNATKNANELKDSLNLTYNKARQAAITTEMLEIVGGANALEKA